MIVLDENIVLEQREILRKRGVRTRQIGFDVGRWGLKDYEILPVLRQLHHPTFFTRDADFYKGRFCHRGYSLVFLDFDMEVVANVVRRFLRHPDYRTQANRMGKVFWVSQTGIRLWRLHGEQEETAVWVRER